jgi:hypothetical protein
LSYTASNYYADLAIMRNEVSQIVGGTRKTVAIPASWPFVIRRFEDDYGLVTLHFEMPRLYLQGIQVGNNLYTFHGCNFQIINCVTRQQTFTEDYAAMGWNKSHSLTPVTLDEVNDAFYQFFAGNPNKKAFRTVVIAFAEGFRFNAIAQKVAKGTAIDGKELDWSAPGATVVQGP